MGNHVSATATASCDIFSLIGSCCLFRRVQIVENLRENLSRLEIQKGSLKAMKADIQRECEDKGDRLLQFNSINEWMKVVDAKVEEVEESLSDKEAKLKNLSCGGCCPHLRCCCVYRFAADIERLLGDINLIKELKNFDLLLYCPPALVKVEMPLAPLKRWLNWEVIRTNYLGSLLKKEMGAVGGTSARGAVVEGVAIEGAAAVATIVEGAAVVATNVEGAAATTGDGEIDVGVILGLFGLRGIGKTSMLKKINNELLGFFKLVIWVDAKDKDSEEIQSLIASRIGHSNELGWDTKNFFERSLVIYNYLKSKKFALLLDNLSSEINLNELGVPYPNNTNLARIIFTTSDRDVYNGMHTLAKVEIGALEGTEAWDLFSQTVGGVNDTKIRRAARDILEVCGGVPRVIISVGRLMRGNFTVNQWYEHCNILSDCQSTVTQSLQLFEVDVSEVYSQAINNHRMKCASTSGTKNASTPISGGIDVASKEQVDKCREKVPELEENA